MNNIAGMLSVCRSNYSAKAFLVHNNVQTTFSLFEDEVDRIAASLADFGISRGDRVVILAHNGGHWLANMFAILATGAAVIPINPGLKAPEVQRIVEHAEPALLIVEETLEPLVEGCPAGLGRWFLSAGIKAQDTEAKKRAAFSKLLVDVDKADPALIFYTSGTTGKPKGVVVSHEAIRSFFSMFSRHLVITQKDRSVITGSLAFMMHILPNALSCMAGGATLIFLDRFHPELAVQTIERHDVTLMMAVPTVYVMMLDWLEQHRPRNSRLPSIRWAITGGAAFPAALNDRARRVLEIPVFDLWGMTECGPMTAYDPARDTESRPGSCGRPLPGCQIRIVDERLKDVQPGVTGEVLLSSPTMMTHYFRDPEATAQTITEGWVRSGDLGRIDADGFLYIVGRIKEMIIRGGANIYPAEVENVLYSHPSVSDCSVVGVPDDTFGEIVNAFVVIRDGHAVSSSELTEHCRERLVEYKVPAQIHITNSLPNGATGKVLRRELRDRHVT